MSTLKSTKRIYKENLQLLVAEKKSLLTKQDMRRQFASDLHDDIGSSLSSIALLSERIKALVKDTLPEAHVLLNKISTNVHASIENTQTIVWAIDTRTDKLAHLISSIKEFCSSFDNIQQFEWILPPKTLTETIDLTPDLKKICILFLKKRSIMP